VLKRRTQKKKGWDGQQDIQVLGTSKISHKILVQRKGGLGGVMMCSGGFHGGYILRAKERVDTLTRLGWRLEGNVSKSNQ